MRKKYPGFKLFLVTVPKAPPRHEAEEAEKKKVMDMVMMNMNEKTRIGKDGINLKIYVNFFKTFCRMPGEHEREVRESVRQQESKWGLLTDEQL